MAKSKMFLLFASRYLYTLNALTSFIVLLSFASISVATSCSFVVSADMFAHEDGGPEPDWVKTEREQFSDFRDLNKDGKMDKEEIRHWIMPQDYDHAQAEARHLVYESDQDKVQ